MVSDWGGDSRDGEVDISKRDVGGYNDRVCRRIGGRELESY